MKKIIAYSMLIAFGLSLAGSTMANAAQERGAGTTRSGTATTKVGK